MLSVGVRRHGAHALGAVLVERVALDDPQASQRLVQHQTAEIISDLLRLWAKTERRVKVRWNRAVSILRTHFKEGRGENQEAENLRSALVHTFSRRAKVALPGAEGEPRGVCETADVLNLTRGSLLVSPCGEVRQEKGRRTGTLLHRRHFLGSIVY